MQATRYFFKQKNRYILMLAFGVLVFSSHKLYAQSLQQLESRFDEFRQSDLQEKLFVHLNKRFFVTGEVLWFKIYDINGSTNAPLDLSKVAYVELLDGKHQPVWQAKISLSDNGEGSMEVPETLPSGSYIFRAYTSWMKNFSPDYYFNEAVTILNTTVGNDFPKTDTGLRYDVQFFPEGGNLVTGIRSEVGFRAVDENGKGIQFSGIILDQDDDTICSFAPLKFGIGHFFVTPDNEPYKAVLHLANGEEIKKTLPKPYQSGYVMHVSKNDKNGTVQIAVQTNARAEETVYLLIHTRESLKLAEAITLKNGKSSYILDLSKLGQGISQITLFNSDLQPVCERLIYKKISKQLNIGVKADKPDYGLREKVKLAFQTTDERKNQAVADMSVSVYRIDSLQGMDQSNIFNYLWLSSDLRGHIEDPNYYFGNDADVDQALDNLMLTQGWRRFDWKNVIDQKPQTILYPPELLGPVVLGDVTDRRTHSPAKDVLTYMAIPGKNGQVYGSVSDRNGKIHFQPREFYGKQDIVVETNTQSRDSLDVINIVNPFSDQYSYKENPVFKFNTMFSQQLQSHSLWSQVQQAYHKKMPQKMVSDHIDSIAFYGKPYRTYDLDDYVRYTTMEEVMREYVLEVAVRKKQGHYHFQTMNALSDYDKAASAVLFQDDPLILLDGVPVFNIDSVMALDPLKVKRLEVVAGRYFWGPIVANGIVSYTTYKGDMAGYKLEPNVMVLDYNGMQERREYFSPKYDKDNQKRIPDFRNALYWSPNIRSDGHGLTQCSFYSSDIPGRYVVVVNGIASDGRAGCGIGYFKVGNP